MSQSIQQKSKDHPLLQQASVKPLDASGFTASIVGMVVFGIGALILWATEFRHDWMLILTTGTGIGLILVAVTAGHRYRRTLRANRDNPVGATPAEVLVED
ncbi:MAG: hypothetical protein LBE83_05630 [Propionibacteriaceae bacterium]|jgi:hypothetical protein|nr:hypothetical protein [Propionibacteriaceae bacterium]